MNKFSFHYSAMLWLMKVLQQSSLIQRLVSVDDARCDNMHGILDFNKKSSLTGIFKERLCRRINL